MDKLPRTLREWRWAGETAIALPLIDIALRLFGWRRCERWLHASAAVNNAARPDVDADRLARIVAGVNRRLPWPARCLPRSLWLRRKLQRLGCDARVILGVADLDVPGRVNYSLTATRKVSATREPAQEYTRSTLPPAPSLKREGEKCGRLRLIHNLSGLRAHAWVEVNGRRLLEPEAATAACRPFLPVPSAAPVRS